MEILGLLFILLYGVVAIVSLVCLIMVIVKMFQNDQSTLGIVTIILSLCTGIGSLIAFVVGWMNAAKWNIRNLMIAWTASILAVIVLVILMIAVWGVALFDELENAAPVEIEPLELEAPEFEEAPEF